MRFILLTGVEWKKLRRSRILFIMGMAAVMLWVPSILNAPLNFEMQAEGISPEHNFIIQGFMGMAWFMFPAGMVVSTVLLAQTERSNHGILRMLALPVSTAKLCMAKFVILLILAAVQMAMMTGMYFLSAAVASQIQDYEFLLSPLFVFKLVGGLYVSAFPMLAFFWMLSPYPDRLGGARACVHRALCINDQYKGVVCVSDGLSILYHNGRIRKAGV